MKPVKTWNQAIGPKTQFIRPAGSGGVRGVAAHRCRSTRNGYAFTLIELLVVITIISILAALVIPALSKSKARANSVKAVSNLRTLGQANFLWSGDNDGRVHGWDSSQQFPRRIAAQILSKSVSDLDLDTEIIPTLTGLRDPNVPPHIASATYDGGYTYAINTLFKIPDMDDFPKISSFNNPAGVMHLASGHDSFSSDQATNATYLAMPESSPRVGLYYSYENTVPANFLDTHAELLKFGFDKEMIDPEI